MTPSSAEPAMLVWLKLSDTAYGTQEERQRFQTLEDRIESTITVYWTRRVLDSSDRRVQTGFKESLQHRSQELRCNNTNVGA